jgi:hypothetical protein
MCGQACPVGASIGIADESAHQPGKALMQATTQAAKNGFLRAAALAVSIAGTLFWLYKFYGIAQVPAGDGSGFQWIAVVPLGLVFFIFTSGPGLRVERPVLVGRTRHWLRGPYCVRASMERAARRVLSHELVLIVVVQSVAISQKMRIGYNDASRFATA